MKLKYNKNELHMEADGFPVKVSKILNYPTTVLQDGLGLREYRVSNSRIIIREELLKEYFEPVEDFNYIDYLESNKEFINYHQVYKHKTSEFYILIDIDIQTDYNEKDVYKKGYYKITYFWFDGSDTKIAETITKLLNDITEYNNDSESMINIVISQNNQIVFKEYNLDVPEIDIGKMYNDDFKEVHKHIIDKLKSGDRGIVMLHGKAGTGKTSYIKYLTKLLPEKRFVFIPVGLIPQLSSPDFISKLIDNKKSILVLEDAEDFIKDRNLSNHHNVVSSILNITDGILSDILGVQLIVTFNTQLSNIDTALLRKGRLIAQYEFDVLSSDKAKELLNTPSVKPDNLTLADIFHINDKEFKQNEKKKIGF